MLSFEMTAALRAARRRASLCALAAGLAWLAGGCAADAPPTAETRPASQASAAPGELGNVARPLAGRAASARVRTAPGVDYIRYPDEPMRPAFTTVLARPPKADEYDDLRALAPERYAITVPAPEGIRPMVEWEPMRAIVMGVPTYMSGYSNAWQTILQIARHSLDVADVWFMVESNLGKELLVNGLLNAGVSESVVNDQVRFLEQPFDSVWFIDYGPLPVVDPSTNTFAFTDFRYYHNRPLDDGMPSLLGRTLPDFGLESAVPTYRVPLNTEGGTFQSTTDGVCITGNRQLYNMSCGQGACDSTIRTMPLAEVQQHPLAQQLRTLWRDYAGCTDVVVTNSITDDGTGHIDMFLKIVSDDTILVGEYVPPFAEGGAGELNRARMDANADFLGAYQRPGGGGFEVARIVMPGHRAAQGSGGTDWMPFTYINSTIINGLNLWPAFTYDEWADSRALAQSQWEEVMPDHEHIWIDSAELSFWSGAIHCITRTIPAAAPGLWVADGTCVDCECQGPYGGYDGECTTDGAASEGGDDLCYGPAWLCGCNNCNGACPGDDGGVVAGGGDPCMGLTYDGCCEADNVLRYCDNGALRSGTCQVGSACGWIAGDAWYDCGGAGEDPTGDKPRDCATVFAAYDGDDCAPDCAGRECGSDGCGGTCGGCNECATCGSSGLCVVDCTDECEDGTGGCDGAVAWACAPGIHGCTLRFETDCEGAGARCLSGVCVSEARPTDGGTDASAGGPDGPADAADSAAPAGGPAAGDDAGPSVDASAGGAGGGSGGCATGGSNAPPAWFVVLAIILVVCRRRLHWRTQAP